ncbi:MAG: hypothetical protein M9921_13240 [Fimbriimonadaceae bacterium]|nr:hypothetical protein [Fimbriimonadaceae bacterium]
MRIGLVANRLLSLVLCITLLLGSSWSGIAYTYSGISTALQGFRPRPGQYTEAPKAPYLGARPSRDPRGRGIWSKQTLQDFETANMDRAQASLEPSPMAGMHTVSVDPAPGTNFPWEGAFQSHYGIVNSGCGNKMTAVPLLSWKCRGGMVLDFTLYNNSQSSYVDELGHHWTWTYDIYINNLTGNPIVHWGDGLCIAFTKHVDGGTTTYIAPAGTYDDLVKNGNDTWTLTKKDGTVYSFNDEGFCGQIEDRNGNAITLSLDANNYVTTITDPTGRQIDLDYDGSHRITSITDPLDRVWEFSYNGSNELTEIEWPDLDSVAYSDTFTYGTGHVIASHTDRRGKTWSFTYNTDASLATETDPLSHQVSVSYASGATTRTDPLSHTRVDNYSSGKLTSRVDESSFSVSFTSRDSNNNVTALTDRRGKSWSLTYDSSGNVTSVTDPLSHAKTFTYNSFSQVLTATDELDNETVFEYDGSGNLETVTDPLDRDVETNGYDAYGQLTSSSNYLDEETTLAYDTDGNLTSITDPLSNETVLVYDDLGHLTSITDANSNTEEVEYDDWGRPVLFTHADASTKERTYLVTGQVLTQTDELSHTTTYAYDNAGRLTSVTNAESETESYGYDAADRRTTVTNGRGKTRTYTFTNRGEAATLTLADSSVEQWSYNGNGDVTAYTNPLSQVIYYTFDDAGRQTGVDYPTGTDTSFSYDDADRLTAMSDATGTTEWTFDDASQVTELETPQGTMDYTYDLPGRRATMVQGSGTTTYSYDDAGRLTSLENPYSETTAFEYDDGGRLTKETFDSGVYTLYGYDSRDRTTSVVHKTSGASTISSESYAWDDAGNLEEKTVDTVTTTYGYDDINQLVSESRSGYSASYTYDANGNRASKTLNGTTETYTVDDADKLTTITSGGNTVKSFTYDTAGRTTAVTTSAGTTSLTYDYEGRITQITYPSTATNTFTYNGLDTRVGKVDSSGTSTYKRDGAGVLAPVLSDGTSAMTPGISSRASSTTTFDHHDYLGTTSLQTAANESTVSTRTYDAFGMPVSTSGTPKTGFGFVGACDYQEDVDSDLKLLGHRYYDPSTGRFLTRDPLGYDRNWYQYVSGNPLNGVDPSGLIRWSFLLKKLAQLVVQDLTDPDDVVREVVDGAKRQVIERKYVPHNDDLPGGWYIPPKPRAPLFVVPLSDLGDRVGGWPGEIIDWVNPIGMIQDVVDFTLLPWTDGVRGDGIIPFPGLRPEERPGVEGHKGRIN